jgi:hypothetical protein
MRTKLKDDIDNLFADYSNKDFAPLLSNQYKTRIDMQFDKNIANDNMRYELDSVTRSLKNLPDELRSDQLTDLFQNAYETLDQFASTADVRLTNDLRESLDNISNLSKVSRNIYEMDANKNTPEFDYPQSNNNHLLHSAFQMLGLNQHKEAQKALDKYNKLESAPNKMDWTAYEGVLKTKTDTYNQTLNDVFRKGDDGTDAKDKFNFINLSSIQNLEHINTVKERNKVISNEIDRIVLQDNFSIQDNPSLQRAISTSTENYLVEIVAQAKENQRVNNKDFIANLEDIILETHDFDFGFLGMQAAGGSDDAKKLAELLALQIDYWSYTEDVETSVIFQDINTNPGSNVDFNSGADTNFEDFDLFEQLNK